MAVSVLSTPTSAQDTTPLNPYVDLTHTCPAGTERLLILLLGIGDSTSRHSDGTPTYGGQNMTQIGTGANEGVFCGAEAWYLNQSGITAATTNIFSISNDNQNCWGIGAICLEGVDQVTPIDTGGIQTATGNTGTTISVTVASAAGNMVLAVATSDDQTMDEADMNQTSIFHQGNIDTDVTVSAQRASGAASVLMQWDPDLDNERYAIIGFEVNASGGAAAATIRKSNMTTMGMN